MSTWTAFEGDQSVPRFIEAAVELHRPLFDRLARDERPFFFDSWLHLLNRSQGWLLADDDRPLALVTVPRVEDAHTFRWQNRTLACRDECRGTITLPAEVDLSRSFAMPRPEGTVSDEPVIAGATCEPVQLVYVRRPDAFDAAPGVEFRAGDASDLTALMDLIERGYETLDVEDGHLDKVREELDCIMRHDGGWCFVATRPGDDTLIAMASYIALPIPLLGTPAALVADLTVDPACRGRGIAPALQRHAGSVLQAAGVPWMYGNIDPDNIASRRQAERAGRAIWVQVVRFRAEEANG